MTILVLVSTPDNWFNNTNDDDDNVLVLNNK